MTEITFLEPGEIDDGLLRFAVIAARFDNQWVFVRHRERTTWEIPGGHREPGEIIDAAALREVKEETGLTLDPEKGQLLFTMQSGDRFLDAWLFRQDFDLSDIVLQPGETVDKMYADKETLLAMERAGELVPCSYLQQMLELC